MRRTSGSDSQIFLSELEKEYFEWLCLLADFQKSGTVRHTNLAKTLYSVVFEHFVPNDDNRAEDGKNLRQLFSQTKGYSNISKQLNKECSVLEMLIALSLHMDYIIEHPPSQSIVARCFWEMLDNLGVSLYDDKTYFGLAHQQVLNNIKKLLSRQYRVTGEGGLFPLRSTKKDQRKVELWYQMQAYIEENY